MTRRSSLRAQAQEIYRQMVERTRGSLTTPTPDRSPQGGGEQVVLRGREQAVLAGREQAGRGEGMQANPAGLTARVRALYEGSAVPVRAIAGLAGVTERTIYKYARKHGWRRRYRTLPRGEAAAAANRGRRWRHGEGFAPVKGADGRFIRREDQDKPVATGLQATDPAGAARAAADCGRAETRAHAAERAAEQERRCAARLRAVEAVNQALHELVRHLDARDKQEAPQPAAGPLERTLMLAVSLATQRWLSLLEAE